MLNGTNGADLILGLGGNDTLNGLDGDDILVGGPSTAGTSGTYADNFNNSVLNGTSGATTWSSSWVEAGDNNNTNSATAGQIWIDNGNNELRLNDADNDQGAGTAMITRVVNLLGATSATISYEYEENSFDAAANGNPAETVTVLFAADGVNFNQTIQVINSTTGSGTTNATLVGPFTATSAIRFVVAGTNANSGTNNPGDWVAIDNLSISFSSSETLNGGAGNDTYVINLGDGIDVINEVSGTDRITVWGKRAACAANRTQQPQHVGDCR